MCSRPVSCSRRRTRAVACFDQMRRAAELKNKLVGTPRGRAWPCRADDGWPCLMVCSPPPRPIYRCAPRLYRAKCHAIFFAAIRNENIRYFVSLFALPACYPEQVRCPSGRLSVSARAHSSKPSAAGLLLWARPARDIDRLLHGCSLSCRIRHTRMYQKSQQASTVTL